MNNKYILLIILLMSANLMSMDKLSAFDLESPAKSKKNNRLPSKIAKIMINNSFFESPEGSNQDNIWFDMDWTNWTEEEIDIIYDILKLEKARNMTPKILVYLYNLQSLYLCIEYNKINKDLKSRQDLSRLNSLLSFKDLISSLINANNEKSRDY